MLKPTAHVFTASILTWHYGRGITFQQELRDSVWYPYKTVFSHLIAKQKEPTKVMNPTSWSFFFLPRDSIGNCRSSTNRRQPYTKNETTATNDTAVRKPAEAILAHSFAKSKRVKTHKTACPTRSTFSLCAKDYHYSFVFSKMWDQQKRLVHLLFKIFVLYD